MKIAPRPYKKDFTYSYASGVFATLELLQTHPQEVIRVFINSQAGSNKGVIKIKEICQKYRISVEIANGLVIKLSNSENCHAIGVFRKYEQPIKSNENHLVLVQPSDMGNVGTIIRTAVGFGIKNIAIIRPGVDIYDPKVVRSSTGAFFRINFSYFSSFEHYLDQHKNNLYSFALNANKKLGEVEFKKPFSLVFGNEGAGLPKEVTSKTETIIIPHSNEIDSLNLSISVGIALYEASKL